MEIIKELNDKQLKVAVIDRLDTTTAPTLTKFLEENLVDINELVLDFEKLVYISSAGLRVLLVAQKTMNGLGSMKVINVNESIKEIFDMTGFSDILTIE